MQRLFRDIGDVAFAAARTETINLPTDFPIVGLHLELDGSLDVDATNTYRDEAPWSAVRNIEVVGDGQVLQSWTGELLAAYNYVLKGFNMPVDVPATGVADPAALRATWYLPFISQGTMVPERTLLDSTRFKVLQLKITWDTAAGAALISAGTMDYNTETHVTVHVEEIDAFAQALGAPFETVIAKPIVQTFAAAVSNGRIALPRSDRVRGVLVRVTDSATGQSLSDTLLNAISVELRRGITRVYQATYDVAQNIMHWDASLTEDYVPGTPSVDGSRCEGIVWIDFHKFGAQNYVDPRGSSEFDILVDVDASTRLDVVPLQIRAAI